MEILIEVLSVNNLANYNDHSPSQNCIPQYRVGHYLKLKLLDKEISEQQLKLSLIGSSYSGISLNDCILNGKLQAESYLKTLPSGDL